MNATKENFENEITSMLNRISQRINSAASKAKVEPTSPSKGEIGNINEMKISEFKLKEMFEAVQCMDEETWEKNRNRLHQELQQISKTMVRQN